MFLHQNVIISKWCKKVGFFYTKIKYYKNGVKLTNYKAASCETASVFLALNGSLNYFGENVDKKVEKSPKSTFSSTFFLKMLTEKLKRPPHDETALIISAFTPLIPDIAFLFRRL